MHIWDPRIVPKLAELHVELQHVPLLPTHFTGHWWHTDLLRIKKHETFPTLESARCESHRTSSSAAARTACR